MKLSYLHECTTTGAIAATSTPLYFGQRKKKKKFFREEGYLSITPIKQPIGLAEKTITQEENGYLGITDKKQTSQPKTKVWQTVEKVGNFSGSKRSSAGFATKGVSPHGYDAPGTGNIIRDPKGRRMTGGR